MVNQAHQRFWEKDCFDILLGATEDFTPVTPLRKAELAGDFKKRREHLLKGRYGIFGYFEVVKLGQSTPQKVAEIYGMALRDAIRVVQDCRAISRAYGTERPLDG